MKKLLLLSLTLLSVMSLWADDRTEEEMQQIAISQLMGAQVKGLFPTQFHVDRLQDYDEFNVYGNDDGFVFVSRDNRFTPVLGYAEGRFDAANMPEGLKWWIEAMNASLQWRRDQGFDEPVAACTVDGWLYACVQLCRCPLGTRRPLQQQVS